jgi:hypothetical protein
VALEILDVTFLYGNEMGKRKLPNNENGRIQTSLWYIRDPALWNHAESYFEGKGFQEMIQPFEFTHETVPATSIEEIRFWAAIDALAAKAVEITNSNEEKKDENTHDEVQMWESESCYR